MLGTIGKGLTKINPFARKAMQSLANMPSENKYNLALRVFPDIAFAGLETYLNPGGPVETAEATTTDITEDASRTIIESEIIGQVGTPEAGGNTGITTIILQSPVGQTDVVDGQIIETTEESRQLNPAIMGIEIGSAR